MASNDSLTETKIREIKGICNTNNIMIELWKRTAPTLTKRAAPTLTQEELKWFSMAIEYAESATISLQETTTGIGCLIASDEEAGNFQSSNDVPELLSNIANSLDQIRGLIKPPDWRDALAYPAKVDDWLLSQWVGAFLRRNHEYQKDYEHFSRLPSHYANGIETSKLVRKKPLISMMTLSFAYSKHPILPGEAGVEYVARTGDETPYDYSVEAHLMEKWKITRLV